MTGRTTTNAAACGWQSNEPHLENIRRQWPRQCEAIHTKLDELNRLESANSTDLDALCNAFGALLGAVFSPREDFWSLP